MNILDKIKKNWNHKESVEKNVIRFSNEQEQRQRRIKKWYPLFIGLFILACLVFPINPLIALCLFIGAISYGSEYVFNSDSTGALSISVLDSTHFVVAYRDNGNSGYGTAIIGTISGSTISYGSEYVFNSDSTGGISVTALDSTHFVVGYTGAYNVGYCKIGTVSNGNQISYGSEYRFEGSAITSSLVVSTIDSTHFIIFFSDNYYKKARVGTVSGTNISFGTVAQTDYPYSSDSNSCSLLDSTHFVATFMSDGGKIKSVIGTISGTNISFGTVVVVCNTNYSYYSCVDKIDSTHFIVAYRDGEYGKTKIGTVSNGNEITYGSEYTFNAASTASIFVKSIDSTHAVIGYGDVGNSNYGTARLATISGSTITFGTEDVFNSASTGGIDISLLDSSHIIIGYRDSGNSNYGTAVIGNLPSAKPSSNFFLFFN